MPMTTTTARPRKTGAGDLAPKLFRAFADPTRLRLLGLLDLARREPALGGELCVCDLIAAVRVPQPTASRHLGYLRRLGLVKARRDGAWSYYRLAAPDGPVHRALIEKALPACAAAVPELASDAARLRAAGRCRPCDSADGDCC